MNSVDLFFISHSGRLGTPGFSFGTSIRPALLVGSVKEIKHQRLTRMAVKVVKKMVIDVLALEVKPGSSSPQ